MFRQLTCAHLPGKFRPVSERCVCGWVCQGVWQAPKPHPQLVSQTLDSHAAQFMADFQKKKEPTTA
jgi:hypothetical protein